MNLLLADDHPIFRKGLSALIKDQFAEFNVDEVENGDEAILKLSRNRYDILILDIDMPIKSGIDVLRHMQNNSIKTAVVVLTMHNDEMFFNEAFDLGAQGFLIKEDSGTEIAQCLQTISKGDQYVSKKLENFLENRANYTAEKKALKNAFATLSNAEYNTLKHVALNRTSKEIAELLFVTEKSIENYRSRICKKLDLSGGSNTLYKWSIEHKDLIIQSDPENL